LFRESDALFQELGEARGSAYMQANVASALVTRGQYAAAEPLLMEVVKVGRALGDDYVIAVNLGNLAIAASEQGDADRATSLFEESLTHARSVGNDFLVSQTLGYKGRAESRNGKWESAEASFLESLTIARALADPVATIGALERFAECAAAKHAHKRAATILGAAARRREEIGHSIPLHEERDHKRVVAAMRAALGDDTFDQAWREGSAMELEEAVRYALNGRVAGGT
jgi:tetratricopeptide (TPR) repeat protein